MSKELSETKQVLEHVRKDKEFKSHIFILDDVNIDWLIEQVEIVEQQQKDIDFFRKKQEVNNQITRELVALNDPRIIEILTKTRRF